MSKTRNNRQAPKHTSLLAGGEEGNDASCTKGTEDVVVGWGKGAEHHEGTHHHEHQEESVIVEKGEGGGL